MKAYLTLILILSYLLLSACKFIEDEDENSYRVLGHIEGLNGEVIFDLNGTEELVVSSKNESDAIERLSFQFRQSLHEEDKIDISIIKQPSSQYCFFYGDISLGGNIFGVVKSQDYSEVYVYCRTYYKNSNSPQSLSASISHTCLIDNDGARCVGDDERYFDSVSITKVPTSLINPKDISTSNTHACAIDDTGVVCWGDDDKTIVPSNLINPRAVKAGDGFSCALDDEGLKCWGSEKVESKLSFDTDDATNLSLGKASACILTDGKPVCRSVFDSEILNVPTLLDNVNEITVYEQSACAIQDKKLYCWGGLIPQNNEGIELSTDFSLITLNVFLSCLANEVTVACTGEPIDSVMADMAGAIWDAKKIEMGSHHLCAMSDEEIMCFGEKYQLQAFDVSLY